MYVIAIIEFDGNQRRHLINVKQAFSVWREARIALRNAGGMHWKTVAHGHKYLYSTTGRRERSVGPESPETEQIFVAQNRRVEALKSRIAHSRATIEKSVRVSKALYLGRLPTIAARILRKLDDAALLDGTLMVAGTNALFAFEAGAGVLFDDAITATEDLDLLWDPRRRISLLLAEADEDAVLALLQQVDRSFTKSQPYQAVNNDAYMVDMIRPELPQEISQQAPRLSHAGDELEPAPIAGLKWLVHSPRYEEVAIAHDGFPVRIVTVDPRAFALHKLWLSKRPNRPGLKRDRDHAQAKAVAAIAVKWLNLSFDDTALSALPIDLMQGLPELKLTLDNEDADREDA